MCLFNNNNELIESYKVKFNVLQDKTKQDKSIIDSLKQKIEFLYNNKPKDQPQIRNKFHLMLSLIVLNLKQN